MKLSSKMTFGEMIECYRAIAGSCETGVRMFVESNIKKPKKNYTINEVIKLTKGQYGNREFCEFFGIIL